jgi:hypothetical protein
MPLHEAADHAGGHPESPYCKHCGTAEGGLQPFEERFERLTQWAMTKDGLDRPTAEVRTREYMRAMPAWRDHPALREG